MASSSMLTTAILISTCLILAVNCTRYLNVQVFKANLIAAKKHLNSTGNTELAVAIADAEVALADFESRAPIFLNNSIINWGKAEEKLAKDLIKFGVPLDPIGSLEMRLSNMHTFLVSSEVILSDDEKKKVRRLFKEGNDLCRQVLNRVDVDGNQWASTVEEQTKLEEIIGKLKAMARLASRKPTRSTTTPRSKAKLVKKLLIYGAVGFGSPILAYSGYKLIQGRLLKSNLTQASVTVPRFERMQPSTANSDNSGPSTKWIIFCAIFVIIFCVTAYNMFKPN